MELVNGKRYLIKLNEQNKYCPIRLAYWFDDRMTHSRIYSQGCLLQPRGFYHNEYYRCPYKNVVSYMNMDEVPDFTSWKKTKPIEGEKYLVYRVGSTKWVSPHYTIRKFHNGSFGSKDVKFWVMFSDLWQ